MDTILSSRNGTDWLKPARRLYLLGHRADSAVDRPVMEFSPVRLEGPLTRASEKGIFPLLLPALHPGHLSEEMLLTTAGSARNEEDLRLRIAAAMKLSQEARL